MKVLSKDNIKPCENVFVFGGGPSIERNQSKINEILQQYDGNIVTISANGYRISDYNVFIDEREYRLRKSQIKDKYLIVSGTIRVKDTDRRNETFKLRYLRTQRDVPAVSIARSGRINHILGNAGFAAILVSSFFSPKKVFLVGFDGPRESEMAYVQNMVKRLKRKTLAKMPRTKALIGKFIKFLQSQGAEVNAFSDDDLWGTDKSSIVLH